MRLPTRAIPIRDSATRLWRAVSIAAGVSGALFLVAMFLRQPGKFADTRYFDPPGEIFIALLVGASGVITLLCLMASSILALYALVGQVGTLSRLRSIAEGVLVPTQAGTSVGQKKQGAAAQRYEGLLASAWPTQIIGVVLVALGWGNAPLVLLTEQSIPGTWPSWLFATQLIVGAAGVIVLALSDGSGARYRNVLRAAWG